MIEKLITGGQSGADVAALCAARDVGVPTGGFAPKGWLTEAGPQKAALQKFGLVECGTFSVSYAQKMRARTWANVDAADVVLILGYRSSGSILTETIAKELGKPYLWILWNKQVPFMPDDSDQVVEWLLEHRPACLCVGGNRESRNLGIGRAVRPFVADVLRRVSC